MAEHETAVGLARMTAADPFRAELLRLREIVCDEDAEAIDRALTARVAFPRCPTHPDVDPRHMWGCPDCLRELRHEAGRRAWTYCADALPEAPGRYEVACWYTPAVKGAPIHLSIGVGFYRLPPAVTRAAPWQIYGNALDVYAWRPIAEDPPPLRPADREWLAAQGVPAEWLGGGE